MYWNHNYCTLSESVLMGKEVFFLLDDDEPHLLFRDAGCPSEVGVLDNDVPKNNDRNCKQYSIVVHPS